MKSHVPTWPADAGTDEVDFVGEASDLLAAAQGRAASCPAPALVPAAAAGVLPADLQARVTAHLDSCPLCRALAEDLGEGGDVAAADAERVWTRVKAGIARDRAPADRDLPSRAVGSLRGRGRTARWAWSASLAAAGAAALVAIALGASWLRLQPPSLPARPPALVDLAGAASVLALDRPAVAWPGAPDVVWRGSRRSMPVPVDLDAAQAAYNAARFGEAAGRLSAVLAREPDLDAARLALGVSLLHLGRSREALAVLDAAGGPEDRGVAEDLRWYASIAALRDGDRPRALRSLRHLCDDGGPRAVQACLGVAELEGPAPTGGQPR